MTEKCEKCGGALIEGEIASLYGVFFYPDGEIKKLKPKRSLVICCCCKQCGHIQDIRAKDVDKLQ